MKVSKLIILLTFVSISSYFSFGQSSTKFLPVMTPASPEAASFTKYGNYQVNLFTGVPEISIPLYEIKIGELKVPISLNYHSAGIKVNDVASRVGLGWDLQAGGSITRKVKGKPDELPGNYLLATTANGNTVKAQSEIDPFTQSGLDYLSHVDQGLYDVEPDIFSYSFPGHGGSYIFNQKNNYAPVLIPYAPISINKNVSPSNLAMDITDESGINYKFDAQEGTSTGGGISITATSAWLMSEMISANKQDSIHFQYVSRTGSGITDSYISDYETLNDNCTGSYACNPVGVYNSDFGTVSTYWQQLTEIDFRNGKIVFEAAPETRLDFSQQYKLQNRLNAIKIFSFDASSNTYTLIRTIKFFHSYFMNAASDPATMRLRLDSLQILTSDGAPVETYRLNYNTSISLPENTSRKKDFWGYFNNVTNLDPFGQPTSIPKMQFQFLSQSNPPANIWVGGDHINARDPDPNYMQAYILQKITFPAGGNTQFEYETNQYLDDQNNPKYAGGLRIKTIKSYTDNNATPIVKTYKYGLNESGYGRNNFVMEDHFFMSSQGVRKADDINNNSTPPTCIGPNTKRTTTFFSNPTNDLQSFDGASVVYPVVTEYTGDATNNTGKTVYTFSDKLDVTRNVGYKSPILTSYHFVRGLLSNKSDFRRNVDNSYSIVAENRKTYQYFPYETTTGSAGLVVFRTLITEGWGGLNYYTGCNFWTDSYSYLYYNYDITTGDNKLITETAINYDQNDPTRYTSVTTNYTYDDKTHLQVTSTQTTNSKGEILASYLTYPYNNATAPYTTMTTNHIFDKVVTETKKNNGKQLSYQVTNYASFAGNNYLPSNIQLQIKSNPIETRALFNGYDIRGNILEMQKLNDAKQSIIWGYQNLNPVAIITNASSTEIAYTSFESDGNGNWAVSSTVRDNSSSVTGKQSYNLVNGGITLTSIAAGKTYRISYWAKNALGGFAIISGTGGIINPQAVKIVNGWTYYEQSLTVNTGPATIYLSGAGLIDELRFYPISNNLSSATPGIVQMTTYTYAPLIGLTSQCDANNVVTYYEYDTYNRLKNIKDYQGNIVKNFQYNYRNSCGPNCYVLPMQTISGSNTLGYPVGVFNVNKQLLGNATTQAQFVSLWNGNAANQVVGVLSAAADPLQFNLTLNTGQTVPYAVIGLRYYQYDISYNRIDAVRTINGEYVDFGDGNKLQLGNSFSLDALPSNTTVSYFSGSTVPYIIHTYPDTSQKTITFYHNDGQEVPALDNYANPATSLNKVKNFRGNLPQYTTTLGGASYQQASANTVANISNWSSLNTVTSFSIWSGDAGLTPHTNMTFVQDFMSGNKGLKKISTSSGGYYLCGYRDTTFKISRLKSDWNTYFTDLELLSISDEHWVREDISALKKLSLFTLAAATLHHTNNPATDSPVPIPVSVLDNVIIQIAAGAGQNVSNGQIFLATGGTTRSSASDAAYNQLIAKGWTINIYW